MGIGSSIKVHPINQTGLMANNIVIDRTGLAAVPTARPTPRVITDSGTGANTTAKASVVSSPRSSHATSQFGFKIQPFSRPTACTKPKISINFRTPSAILVRKTTVRVQPKENGTCNSQVIDISDETIREGEIIVDTPTEKIYVSKVRRWQIFPGNAKFWCDGRFIHGTDRHTFYASFAVIQIIFGGFAAFVLPFLMKVTPLLLLPFITAFCYTCVVSTMLYSAYTDPGIIPRATKSEIENSDKKFLETSFIPSVKEQINGKPVIRRWCPTCLFYKPPRATHCRTCDHCVERFDHHCPFIGNCVGQRNYPTFFMFLVSVILSCLYVIGCCCGVIAYEYASDMDNFYRPDKPTVASWVVGIATFAVLVAVGFLFGLHLGLISQDLTTNEDYKFDGRPENNPFDQKSIWKNWCQVLCTPRLPSLIQRRAYVTQDFLDSLYYQEAVNRSISKKYGAAKDEPEQPKHDVNRFKIMPSGKDGKLAYPKANYHFDPTKEVAGSPSTHVNNNTGHTSNVYEVNHLPLGPSLSLEESKGLQNNAATNHTHFNGHSSQQQDLRVSGFQLKVQSSETIDSLGDTPNNVTGNHSLAQISIHKLELSRESSDPSLPFIISRETVLIHEIFSKQLLTPSRSREGPELETISLPINLVHHSNQSICRSFSCTQPTVASYASDFTKNPGISSFSSPAKDDILIGVQMHMRESI